MRLDRRSFLAALCGLLTASRARLGPGAIPAPPIAPGPSCGPEPVNAGPFVGCTGQPWRIEVDPDGAVRLVSTAAPATGRVQGRIVARPRRMLDAR